LEGKPLKETHAILIETLACYLPGRAKDLSAPLYKTKVAVYSEISIKHSTQSEHQVEVLNANPGGT